MKKIIKKLYKYLNKIEYILIVLFMSGMLINVTMGVFYRYVLNNSLSWTEEMARYLMIWFAFIGMSLALENEKHVGVIVFINQLPEKIRLIVEILGKIIIMFFIVFLFRYSFDMLKVVKIQTTPALGISMKWPYLAVTSGALLMIIKNIKVIYLKIVEFIEA